VPGVKSAAPVIVSYCLINAGDRVFGAQVMGYPIEQIGKVNNFPASLYLQHKKIEDDLKALPTNAPAEQRDRLEKMLGETPTFGLLDESFVHATLPTGMKTDPKTGAVVGLKDDLADALRYDAARGGLVFKGVMEADQRAKLDQLSNSPDWAADIDRLYDLSHRAGVIDYRSVLPTARTDPANWPGMIVGSGVIGIGPNEKGEIPPPDPYFYQLPVTLTTLRVGSARLSASDMSSHPYWIVDVSRTGVWQYDNKVVYVPFNVLQRDLDMDGREETDDSTGQKIHIPSYTSEVDVSIDPAANLDHVCAQVQAVVHQVWTANLGQGPTSMPEPKADTWLKIQGTWINAIENEKVLTVFLFAIISVVAIFLIFCIFYMIAVEKTKDIGIIKSVGATSGGVAGIFLGYGATIGIIGGGMGLLLSFLIVHNINELHAQLGKWFGIKIWNPEVYMFDKIPNTMAWDNIIVIVGVAILASILGALIPALYAAWLNPVDALRFE
jgi:hypothetical protein